MKREVTSWDLAMVGHIISSFVLDTHGKRPSEMTYEEICELNQPIIDRLIEEGYIEDEKKSHEKSLPEMIKEAKESMKKDKESTE